MRASGPAIAAVVLAAGCVRDPEPALCPQVAVGDLVVTEIRGPQSPDDGSAPWIELYNASTRSIDLEGVKVRFRKKDGSSEIDALVRRSLALPAGGYTVLGVVPDNDTRPAFIDYGMGGDFMVGFLPAAAVDVEACGDRIDRAVYDVLPKQGTFSLGATPPTADANDLPTSWCTDATMSGAEYLGTPQHANLPCP